MPVDRDEAKLTITPSAIDSLPTGHTIAQRSGRATAAISRTANGTIEVTATCDSLAQRLLMMTEKAEAWKEEAQALRKEVEDQQELIGHTATKPTGNVWWALMGAIAGVVVGYIIGRIRSFQQH